MSDPDQELSGKTAVVTGAGGFIGSHLTERLALAGCRVRALVRYNSRSDTGFLSEMTDEVKSRVEVTAGDIRDPFATKVLVEGADIVFHLAALIGIPYSYTAPQSYVETNLQGTLNFLEACRVAKTPRIVVTSTSEVYGTAIRTPIDEGHPLQGQSPYSATKIAADMMAMAYARSFGLPVVVVRPFNTFGPRQSLRAFIPTVIVQALVGGEIRLGDTTPVRDLVFVEDTVSGFISAGLRGKVDGRPYNLATGQGRTVGEVAEKIVGMTGGKSVIRFDPLRVRPENSEVRLLIGDARRANSDLNWKPAVEFETGLQKTISWIGNNLDRFSRPAEYHR